MSEKLVLIDGHSILNRAFFGIPDLTNSEGLHTNAVSTTILAGFIRRDI